MTSPGFGGSDDGGGGAEGAGEDPAATIVINMAGDTDRPPALSTASTVRRTEPTFEPAQVI